MGTIISSFLLAGLALYAVSYESKQRLVNHNDERWRMVIARANGFTLKVIMFLTVAMFIWLTLGNFGFVRELGNLGTLFSQSHLFSLLYASFYLLPFVIFILRVGMLKYFDKQL